MSSHALTRCSIFVGLLVLATPMLADNVTISGTVNFSALDGSSMDHDGAANGVFTVSDGNLTVLGTVNCNDEGPGNASACPMRFVVSGNLTLDTGSGIFAENRRGQGSGGDISFSVGGNLLARGPSGSVGGSVISSGAEGSDRGGNLTFNVGGSVGLEAGSVVSAASSGGAAGAISVSGGSQIHVVGLVAAGASRTLGGGRHTGQVLLAGSSNQAGGAITITSTSTAEPSIIIDGQGTIVSQAENNAAGRVNVAGCGVEVRGVVASIARSGPGAVIVRSGTTLLVDGRDIGAAGPRQGHLRADSTSGDAANNLVRVLARNGIQILGPAAGTLHALSSNPGGTNAAGGTVDVVSTQGTVTGSGNVAQAGDAANGRSGGAINISARENVNLDGGALRAVGENPANNERGGRINVRSYSGAVSWQSGVGDVRPVGSASGIPVGDQGTITITYCTSVSTSGTSFPTNGAPSGVFPTIASNCTPSAPALPPDETLPDCNDPPTANNDVYTVAEGGTLNVPAPGVLANDVEPDGQPMTAILVTGPSNGTLTLNSNGSFTYVHNGSETTSDSFTYRASDGSLNSNVATVTIVVTPVNDAPVAVNDAYTVAEGGTLNLGAPGVLANDTDPDGPQKNAVLVSGPANGTLVLSADGSFTYVHNGSETTSDSFTYKVNDGVADSNVATVSITVTPVNDAPVAANDAYSVAEGGTLNVAAPGVLGNDTDAESSITAVLVSGPANGTLTLNANGSFTYVHNGSETTSDSFTYRASDGSALSNVASVSITVTAVNDAPVANNDSYSTNEGGTLTVPAPGVLANDTDADSATLTAVLVSGPAHGTVTLNADGSFTYVHDGSETTSDSFSYRANDGSANSNVATVTIAVAPVNDAPVANGDSYSVAEGGTLNVAAPGVLANDTDPDSASLTATLVTGPVNGTLTFNADGSFTYVHNGSETTSDSFTYKANDGSLDSNIATVNITVTAVSDAPIATNDFYSTTEGGTLNIAAPGVLANDTDVDNPVLTAVLVTGPSHGTLTLNANGSFTYTHDGSETTSDSFTYKANDGTSDSNVATVTIAVAPVNDAPVAVNDVYSVAEGGTLTVPTPGVLGNDTDADSAVLTAVLVTGPANGSLTLNSDGSFVYVHNGGETTSDSFTYRANDGSANSNIATVNITVTAVNDAPVANNDAYTAAFGGTLNVPAPGVLGNDVDPDSSLTAVLVSGPSKGTLTLNTNGSFTYVHNGTSSGLDSFTYKANDGTADSNVATVTISIVAQPPVANNDVFAAVGNTELRVGVGPGLTPAVTIAGSVLANDTDADTPPSGLSVSSFDATSAAGGTVTMSPNGTFTYMPPVGFLGTDSFNYVVTDGMATDSGTVTIVVSNRVWYVNNTALPGDGRSKTPFNALTDAETASAFGDHIYVHTGNGTSFRQSSGIVLKHNQKLIGEGVALVVSGHTLNPAGAAPLIENSMGSAVLLSNNNVVAGLRLGGFAHGIAGGSVVGGSISSVSVTANGNGINLVSPTSSWSLTDVTLTPGGNGLVISGGTPAINASNLDIVTTSGTGILATGTASGGLSIAAGSDGSTVSTTNGVAIDIIGMSLAISLRSVSAALGATGVSLNGTSGSFTVTGAGTPASGGTIVNTTSRGLTVTGATFVSLSWMTFTNAAGTNGTAANVCGDTFAGTNLGCNAAIHVVGLPSLIIRDVTVTGSAQIGINGNGVNNLTMSDVEVTNAGNEPFEHGIQFVNLGSLSSLTNVNSHHNFGRQFTIQNRAVTLLLNVTGSTFRGSAGSQGVLVSGHGGGTIDATVISSTFADNLGAGWFSDFADDTFGDLRIIGNTFTNNGGAVAVGANGSGTVTVRADNNVSSFNSTAVFSILKGILSSGPVTAIVRGNQIGQAGVAGSGCGPSCEAISLTSTGSGDYRATVENNGIRQFASRAIGASAGTGGSNMQVRIANNTIAEPGPLAANAIFVQSGTSSTDTTSVCADVTANSIAGAYPATAIRVRNRFPTTLFSLPFYAGAGSDTTAVAAFLSGQNGGATASATINGNIFGGGPACTTP